MARGVAATDVNPPLAAGPGPIAAPEAAALVLLPIAVLHYAVLLTGYGALGLFTPVDYGLTFNSMLVHLLDGRFDVDPAAIGREGYLRDGAVYAYFGIFPALLRAPLLVLPDFAATDFTRVSCLLAASLMALFKTLSVLAVWRSAAASRHSLLPPLTIAAVLWSGAQIQFLWPSIFVESVLWSGVFAAAFVYLVLCGWRGAGGFTSGILTGMAVIAGLCLSTRVSTALGLYAGFGLIWLWRCGCALRRGGSSFSAGRAAGLIAPTGIALGFAGATAFVNYQRWENPLVFVDLSRALMLAEFPERADRLLHYGAFNPIRLGVGLIYYFLPIWAWRDGSGQLLFADFIHRTMDSVELPPGSFLVSDPLLLALAVCGAAALLRSRKLPNRVPIILAAAGLTVPIGLMLIAISMTFRYRMEFYPFAELLALVGLWRLAGSRRNPVPVFAAGVIASIVAAHGFWFLTALSPFGPAAVFLGDGGVLDFYAQRLR
jgi:hypothetical protein